MNFCIKFHLFLSPCVDVRACSPVSQPILQNFLSEKLPSNVTVQDASIDTIALLRVINALNRHWASMYDVSVKTNTSFLIFFNWVIGWVFPVGRGSSLLDCRFLQVVSKKM